MQFRTLDWLAAVGCNKCLEGRVIDFQRFHAAVKESREKTFGRQFAHSLQGLLRIEGKVLRLGPGHGLVWAGQNTHDRVRITIGHFLHLKPRTRIEGRALAGEHHNSRLSIARTSRRLERGRDLLHQFDVVRAVPRLIEVKLPIQRFHVEVRQQFNSPAQQRFSVLLRCHRRKRAPILLVRQHGDRDRLQVVLLAGSRNCGSARFHAARCNGGCRRCATFMSL